MENVLENVSGMVAYQHIKLVVSDLENSLHGNRNKAQKIYIGYLSQAFLVSNSQQHQTWMRQTRSRIICPQMLSGSVSSNPLTGFRSR